MVFLITIFIIGLSGIVAQIVILRELLINFYGNELTVGIILSNWLMFEAAGVFIFGRAIERVKNKIGTFILLNLLFALILPVVLYYSRTFKSVIGVPFVEVLSLPAIFFSTLIIIFPVALIHGALFSCGCSVYRSIAKVYCLEALGTVAGGLILAFLFIPALNSFQIVFIIVFLNIFLLLVLFTPNKAKYFSLLLLVLLFSLFFNPAAKYLHKRSIEKQWQGEQVLDYKDSNYANITVTKKLGQYTFFYNGIPVISTPVPDKQFVAEFGNFPLLFHQSPSDILIAGGGSGGLIREALRHPLLRLDYVEIDPLIIKMLKNYPTTLSEEEFADKRVNFINTDPRIFLKEESRFYDVVLIGFSNQADLSSNRMFTVEFFKLVKNRLKPDGMLALWMPGSLTYLGKELKDLNSCVFNSLKLVYKYTRAIPGDYNIFIASDSGKIFTVTPDLITERLRERNISAGILIPDYLEERLGVKLQSWFSDQIEQASQSENTDLRPAAIYEAMKISNKKFSPKFNIVLDYFNRLNLKTIFFIIFVATIVLAFISKRLQNRRTPVAYAIFTTGFFGMLTSLLLIFAYQAFYGCLYQDISLLSAAFIFGTAIGSVVLAWCFKRIKNIGPVLITLEALLVVFSLILGFFSAGNYFLSVSTSVIYSLLFVSGLFVGLEFSLAAKLYLGPKDNAGRSSGLLYASDLAGGWLAGILGSVVFLPVLGFTGTCLTIAGFKLSSLIFYCFLAPRW